MALFTDNNIQRYLTNPKGLWNSVIVVAALLCAWFAFLLAFGDGTIRFVDIPSDASININGHIISERTIQLRPGDYVITITSPRINVFSATIHLGIRQRLNYSPTLMKRSITAIASSVIGGTSYSGGPVTLGAGRWFDDNTWIAGYTDDYVPVALGYSTKAKQWTVQFYGVNNYPQDTARLPADVATYIRYLEAKYVSG